MHTVSTQRGLTLIETIVYIALFSIIMTGGFVTAFELIDGTSRLSTKSIIQEETNFVLRKMDWALSGSSISTPSAGTPYAQTLTLTKAGYGSNPIEIRYNSGAQSVEIREGGGTWTPLTTANVQVGHMGFAYIPAVGTGPAGITASTTINGSVATSTHYIRD